jgi:hypothetical protein
MTALICLEGRSDHHRPICDNDPLLQEYAEAQLVVRVMVTEIFRNCPRYVHRYKKIQPSEFVPRSTCETPFARGSGSMICRPP